MTWGPTEVCPECQSIGANQVLFPDPGGGGVHRCRTCQTDYSRIPIPALVKRMELIIDHIRHRRDFYDQYDGS